MTDTSASSAPIATPKPKSSVGKLIKRMVLIFFLLVVVGLVALYFSLNPLVRAGVVRGGKEATAQDTFLQAANLNLFGGTLKLDGLDIDNLKSMGFTTPKVLVMKGCEVTVQPSSLFTDTVVIDEIAISGLEITIEQNGLKNNLNELMQIIQSKTAATGAANTPPGKKLKITKVSLGGTQVHIRGIISKDFQLDPMEIKEPLNPDGREMKIADLMGRILLQISKQMLNDPNLPKEFRDGMKNVTAIVDNLKGELDKGVKQFRSQIDKVAQDAGKQVDGVIKDATKQIDKGVQDVLKNPFGNQPPK